MNKTRQKILCILLTMNIFFFMSCSTDNLESNDDVRIRSTDLTIEEIDLLKTKFHFTTMNQSLDISNDENLINEIVNSELFREEKLNLSDFDLTKVLEILWNDANAKSYSLKKKEKEEYYTFILTDKTRSNTTKSVPFILKVDADAEGTGRLIYTDSFQERVATFENGTLIDEDIKMDNNVIQPRFRDCFDGAYDSVCDGFVGCLAWYTNPQIAIACAIFCAL